MHYVYRLMILSLGVADRVVVVVDMVVNMAVASAVDMVETTEDKGIGPRQKKTVSTYYYINLF